MQNVISVLAVESLRLDSEHLTPVDLLLALLDLVVEHPYDLLFLLPVQRVQLYFALSQGVLATRVLLVRLTPDQRVLHAVHEVTLRQRSLFQQSLR